MGLCGSTIKKFLLFQETEFSYISRNGNLKKHPILQEITFHTRKKKKTNPPQKNFFDFLKRKLFLYFEKRKPQKNYLYFTKRNFLIFWETSYISASNFLCLKNEKNHSEKTSYIPGGNLQSLKIEKYLYFSL